MQKAVFHALKDRLSEGNIRFFTKYCILIEFSPVSLLAAKP